FFAGGQLKKIDVLGGTPQPICSLTGASATWGGAWNAEGNILFSSESTRGLQIVSAERGTPLPVTTLDASRGEVSHLFPRFLPDARHFLYLSTGPNPQSRSVYVGSLDSKETKRIVDSDTMADFGGGYLLFVRDDTLFAQEFDSDKLELRGQRIRVA